MRSISHVLKLLNWLQAHLLIGENSLKALEDITNITKIIKTKA